MVRDNCTGSEGTTHLWTPLHTSDMVQSSRVTTAWRNRGPIPIMNYFRPGMVVHACYHNTQETEAQGLPQVQNGLAYKTPNKQNQPTQNKATRRKRKFLVTFPKGTHTTIYAWWWTCIFQSPWPSQEVSCRLSCYLIKALESIPFMRDLSQHQGITAD